MDQAKNILALKQVVDNKYKECYDNRLNYFKNLSDNNQKWQIESKILKRELRSLKRFIRERKTKKSRKKRNEFEDKIYKVNSELINLDFSGIIDDILKNSTDTREEFTKLTEKFTKKINQTIKKTLLKTLSEKEVEKLQTDISQPGSININISELKERYFSKSESKNKEICKKENNGFFSQVIANLEKFIKKISKIIKNALLKIPSESKTNKNKSRVRAQHIKNAIKYEIQNKCYSLKDDIIVKLEDIKKVSLNKINLESEEQKVINLIEKIEKNI